MAETVGVSAYLVLSGKRQPGERDDEGLFPIREAKIVGLRQSRPANLGPDQVAILVNLRVPVTYWLHPQITVQAESRLLKESTVMVAERVIPDQDTEEDER